MSKRKHEEVDGASGTAPSAPTFTSTPIHDRSSVFTAIFTPSTDNPRAYQRHVPFETAGHKILAWRRPSNQKSLTSSFSSMTTVPGGTTPKRIFYEVDSDEDGEKYAGKKLEKVLAEMDVVGTVVVARWYGGVLLGPVRFKWIEDSAREAIRMWRASVGGDLDGSDTKKVKGHDVLQDLDCGKEKEKLINVLKQRDTSVSVLRDLLAEKTLALKSLKQGVHEGKDDCDGGIEVNKAQGPSIAILGYDTMPIQRLKQLEKARDATLSWILKQIDTIEEKLKNTKAKDEI